ncbi:MAG TPA: hypothetical protein VNE39_00255 [Planctomycetota bacterium]|nr:hypothetical protein [Planctomycetota bacterium]
MASDPQGIQKLSPDKLLTDFTKTKVLWCFLIAVAIHLVATAATSIGYIRDRWVDPEGAARRKAAQLDAAKADVPSPKPKVESPRPDASRPEPKEAKAKSPDDAPKGTPVMKEITELPKKGEIPKAPDDLGISIDETNK